ncbi:hypothetical protein AZH53_07425 [Methanomicrobiaceae archaeon CYW5]|uniref:DUF460 domain-containing protein n=1 Tax=Methanovulcanius yangii TaxID=1789227 RepID=UPI0029C9FF06|nr:DUF460 domain-containing protein [Methanovulcanius yangii]MBT8508232.1 hypothetical protein [Methanovulcanius yangii]
MKVFGIDIIRGSVRSRTKRPHFALVQRVDGEEVSVGEVSLYRLLRTVADEEPDILAVDSVQELAPTPQDLFAILQALPPATILVQSTGGEKQESLPRIAGRYNLKFNKYDPYAEARASAHVAELGGGAEVIAFENTCDIIVSRGRSLGKGGWSQNRYARKVHGAVRQTGRDVEAVLDREGLSYTRHEVKAFGGLGRVHFEVAAPREDIPVRNMRLPDVQVKVSGRRLDRIRYRPLSPAQRYLIVGIDPGTTVGLAALSLDGELVCQTSSRQMAMPDVIEALYTSGKPLVVATDVSPMPASVERIRRAFAAVAYTPKGDISVEEKKALCEGYPFHNDHERDSLAAAVAAYRHYQGKFRNIAKRVPPGSDLDEIRAGVVRGLPLEQILGRKGVPAPAEEAEEKGEVVPGPRDDRLLKLDGMVKSLRAHVTELQDEMAEKDREITRLEGLIGKERSRQAKDLRKEAEIAKRDEIITTIKKRLRREERKSKKLIRQIERLRRLSAQQAGEDRLPVKVLPSLSRDGVRSVDGDLGIGEGDVLYVKATAGWGTSVLDLLAQTGIRALLTREHDARLETEFLERELVLLDADAAGAEVRGRVGSVPKEGLEEAEERWEKRRARWTREKKSEMIESIYKEYLSEREREVKRHG